MKYINNRFFDLWVKISELLNSNSPFNIIDIYANGEFKVNKLALTQRNNITYMQNLINII